ncbi:MAG: hypothetical protein GF393_05690, partial [Armatimonadia bacterium]|nr:hypothetical protein [Armatimonadia bacterium]
TWEGTREPRARCSPPSRRGADKSENVENAFSLLDQAASEGARLIALPENFDIRGGKGSGPAKREAAEPIPGPLSERLSEAARRCAVYLLGGSYGERVEGQDRPGGVLHLIHHKRSVVGLEKALRAPFRLLGQARQTSYREYCGPTFRALQRSTTGCNARREGRSRLARITEAVSEFLRYGPRRCSHLACEPRTRRGRRLPPSTPRLILMPDPPA